MQSTDYVFTDNSCTHLTAHTWPRTHLTHQFSANKALLGQVSKSRSCRWLKPMTRPEPEPVGSAEDAQSSAAEPKHLLDRGGNDVGHPGLAKAKCTALGSGPSGMVSGHPWPSCVMYNLDQVGSTWIKLASFQPCRHSEVPEDHLWFVWHSKPT